MSLAARLHFQILNGTFLVPNLWNPGSHRNFLESTPEGGCAQYALCPSHRCLFFLNSNPGASEPVSKSDIHLTKARPHLVYFIGTAALLSMVRCIVLLMIRDVIRRPCGERKSKPRLRSLTFEPRRPIVSPVVLASCHDTACNMPLSITVRNICCPRRQGSPLLHRRVFLFHQRSSDSTVVAANRTRYLIPFSVACINHFAQFRR